MGDLIGHVDDKGSLELRIEDMLLTSKDEQCRMLVDKRGGYLDLAGMDGASGQTLAWRLYVVIAAETFSAWTDPHQQSTALLMGTHPRLGAESPVLLLDDNILRLIHSFV